jgi:hypothetical protein
MNDLVDNNNKLENLKVGMEFEIFFDFEKYSNVVNDDDSVDDSVDDLDINKLDNFLMPKGNNVIEIDRLNKIWEK